MDRVHHKRFHGIRYAFILTAAAVFLWGIMCGSAPAAESVELKLAHFMSPLHVQHGAILFFMMLFTLIEMAGGQKELIVDAQKPVLLTTLLDRLAVPQEEVGIIVRNRKRDAIDCVILEEDVVKLFPILSGG